jgi:hypothetical protein
LAIYNTNQEIEEICQNIIKPEIDKTQEVLKYFIEVDDKFHPKLKKEIKDQHLQSTHRKKKKIK